MKSIVFALIPLILSIGIIPAIPFSDAVEQTTEKTISRVFELKIEDWVNGRVSDTLFVVVIKYLAEQNFISIPNFQTPDGDFRLFVPSWLKTTGGYWIDKDISDDEFAKGLEWLINNEIIKFQQ